VHSNVKLIVCKFAFAIMNRSFKIFILILLIANSGHLSAQIFKKEILFGVFANPVIATNLIQKNDVELYTDTINYQLLQRNGINYGMEIRMNIGERLAAYTGIGFTQRNYGIKIYTEDSVLTDSSLKFISYEIPLNFNGYVKLAEHLYLNGNLGFKVDFYPSEISIPHIWGKRYNWAQFALSGGTGLELRTENIGYFYLGASYHTHFNNMLYVFFYKSNLIGLPDQSFPLSGNYFSVNLKYYFPIGR